jgi:hypothetical protein
MNIFQTNKGESLVGKRIVLDHMDDQDPIPAGSAGTIFHVDGWGQIHVKWDNGRSLAVIPEKDKFQIEEK